VKEIQEGNEKIANTNKQEILIFYVISGRPGNSEKGESYNNAENFGKAVK
jgi:hypothetical protein